MKILIANDNPVHLLVTMSLVQELGFECRGADNGKDAQRMMMNEYFDLVFLKLNLPDKDAHQIINVIRYSNQYYLKKLPVIVMSTQELSNKELSILGFNGILKKSLNHNELKNICMKYWKCKLNTLEKDGSPIYAVNPESTRNISSLAKLAVS